MSYLYTAIIYDILISFVLLLLYKILTKLNCFYTTYINKQNPNNQIPKPPTCQL